MLQLVLTMLSCLAFELTSYRTCFFVVRDEASLAPPPGSKEDGRGGNDGTDIAIMPYMSFKTPLLSSDRVCALTLPFLPSSLSFSSFVYFFSELAQWRRSLFN